MIQNERTYVPVRFSTENLNAKVDRINSTREAVITYPTGAGSSASANPQTPSPTASVENPPDAGSTESQPVVSASATETSAANGNANIPVANVTKGGATAPSPAATSDNTKYSTSSQPVFFMEDRYEKTSTDEGRVTFQLKRPIYLEDYTGFRVYFTEQRGDKIFEFTEDAFAYTEKTGLTVDLGITALNETTGSTPQYLTFTMLDRVKGKTYGRKEKAITVSFLEHHAGMGLHGILFRERPGTVYTCPMT